jgi:hypothetical protein
MKNGLSKERLDVPDYYIHANFIKTILNDGNKGMGHEILR